MLHLSGFDDRTDAAFRRMHTQENDILTRLGLGPLFGAIEQADAPGKARERAQGNPSRAANPKQVILSKRRRQTPAAEMVGVE